MRRLISVVEARPPAAAPDAQTVYNRALTVGKTVSRELMLRHWDQEWVIALRKLVADARRAHEASEAEEAKYAAEYDEEYQPQPFNLDTDEVAGLLWDRTITLHVEEMVSAAKSEYERYQDDHPRVEQSDQMSLHQDEIRLTTTIGYRGDLSLDGMMAILGALNDFAGSLAHYSQIDYTNLATRETMDFVAKIIPAIVAVCQLRGAKPQA